MKILMWADPFKLITDHLPQDILVQRFSCLLEIFAQRLVDHSLIAISSLVSTGTKFFEDIRIKVNGDACFAFLRSHEILMKREFI